MSCVTWKIINPRERVHSSELVNLDAFLCHVFEVQRLVPLTGAMVVIAFHDCFGLLKTNVIETSERGPVYVPYGVVRHEEVLLPAHEHVITIR